MGTFNKHQTKLLFLCISGSKAYGTNTADSDTDLRGVFVNQDPNDILGITEFAEEVRTNPDSSLFELRKFVRLALQGNTIACESMWVKPEEVTPLGQQLLDMRDSFLSMRFVDVFRGYAISEHRKTVGVVSGALGEKRKELIKKYGYSVKNATQCLRLLWQGTILAKTGQVEVYISDDEKRAEMIAVKTGQVPINEYILLREKYLADFEQAVRQPRLPHSPNSQKIWNWVCEVYRNELISSGSQE